jgi:hypothetical protein
MCLASSFDNHFFCVLSVSAGVTALATAISGNVALIKLDISNNRITHQSWRHQCVLSRLQRICVAGGIKLAK